MLIIPILQTGKVRLGDVKPKVTQLGGGSSVDVPTTAMAPKPILLNATLKLPLFTENEQTLEKQD